MKNISEWLASNGLAGAEFVDADRGWHRSTMDSWRRPPVSPDRSSPLAFLPADHPGHLLVTARRVQGAWVYDRTGDRIGRVFDVAMAKGAGNVVHVLLAVGGVLGFGRRFYPLPWNSFSYAQELRGYWLPSLRSEILARPSLRRDDLEWYGAGSRSPFADAYCHAFLDFPVA